MRVLLVEDDTDFCNVFLNAVGSAGIDAVAASNRADARVALEDETDFFDLAILDLRIPSGASGLDADVEHGLATYADLLEVAQGTPVVAFSAFGTVDVMMRLLEEAGQDDPFGAGHPEQMLRFLKKSQLPEAVDFVKATAARVAALDSIEIAFGSNSFPLISRHRRALRILASRLGGRVVKPERVAGGMSSAQTVRVRIESGDGEVVARTIAKLDAVGTLATEREKYGRLAAARLDAHLLAPLGEDVRAGAGGQGLICYSIAGDTVSLAERLSTTDATQLVGVLRERLQPLREGAPARTTTVEEIRRLLVSDEAAVSSGIRARAAIEHRSLQVRWGTHHGDLHGANVLIDREAQPIVIDFARAGAGPPSLDAVTLSLSTVFHPASASARQDWPAEHQMRAWDDLDGYIVGCPFPDFIRACRDWAHEVAAGDLEIFAVAYAYALRQMQFEGTDKDLARALIDCCERRLTRP